LLGVSLSDVRNDIGNGHERNRANIRRKSRERAVMSHYAAVVIGMMVA